MRRVPWDEFMRLPQGTIFFLYDPQEDCPYPDRPMLAVKGSSMDNDFLMLPFAELAREVIDRFEGMKIGDETFNHPDIPLPWGDETKRWELERTFRYDNISYYVLSRADIDLIISALMSAPNYEKAVDRSQVEEEALAETDQAGD